MGVGTLRCVVINVTDLQLGYKFWGAVTGLEVIGSETGWHDWLGYLGTKDPWKHEIILQRVDTSPLEIQSPDPETPNQVHIDITPNDGVDNAIKQIVELGGRVKKAPSLYPRPGSHGADPPIIDWAVLQDPFGNEFCLVSNLTPEQSQAAMAAVDATTDQEWRTAGGVARSHPST
jgi:catechol 2,3-dioxygenase-like lactoylglutathione lyase family enzyme